jgi:hypothetical protein
MSHIRARDYEYYARHELKYRRSKEEKDRKILKDAGIKIERNVFVGLSRVNVAELHKPDLLHNVYLGLFKHLMEWVEGFLKTHGREQAFNDVWKSLPPYPGFFVPKKAYYEITQWQGKEMRNLGRCISGVLASALRNPNPAKQQMFKRALTCVNSLVDFSLMAQYRSHTPETLDYMDSYLDEFHRTKDVFLEFRVSKRTKAKANEQDKTLRHEQSQRMNTCKLTRTKRVRLAEDNRVERSDVRRELIHEESHFNFIKMHLVTHFRRHVERFGNIPMFSTDVGEIAHKEQIKEGWRKSNKNNAARQILHHYSRQHAIGMRIQTLATIEREYGADKFPDIKDVHTTSASVLSTSIMAHIQEPFPVAQPVTPRRILRGRRPGIKNLVDFCLDVGLSLDTISNELSRYSRKNLEDTRRLPADVYGLQFLPLEQFTQLQIPVPAFQEPDKYDIHHARCTGTRTFRNGGSRNDWVWVRFGSEEDYGALHGRIPARLMGLIKLRNKPNENIENVHRLAIVRVLDVVNNGHVSDKDTFVRVKTSTAIRQLWIVDIGTITGQAHLIADGDGRWLINSRIDLRTFNEIY